MFRHKAYGLAIISDVELPELPRLERAQASSDAGLEVRLRAAHPLPKAVEWRRSAEADGVEWFKYARIGGGYILRYPGTADFFVDTYGRLIERAAAAPGVSIEGLRHLLLDQVMPRVLNLRGLEALHATAIAVGGRVCAFVGTTGSGKSTLAASFQRDGYASVCDDCLVLREAAGAIVATPGYPGVRLWKDSLQALALFNETAVPMPGYSSKFRLLGGDAERFCDREYPLVRIYILSRDESGSLVEPRIKAMSPAQAFPAVVKASFPLDFADRAMLERHFRTLTHLANSVAVRSLEFPSGLAALSRVKEIVLRDVGQG
jgi:hypothetical protein